jgi:thiamine-monophosphate kinase
MTGKRTRRGEFELIAELFSPLTKGAPGALGLMDDAALIDVSPGCELVVTVDTLIAGVHFRLDDPPDLIARKALRVNFSDLAAKGAKPIGFLHALALNDGIDDAFLERYAAGLKADVEYFNVPLLGGDTTSGPGPLTISVTAFGEVKKGRALLRRGARLGDVVCVTGTIGDGAIGLDVLNAAVQLPEALAMAIIERYRLPQPRFIAESKLAGCVSACMDLSDGLVADVGHLCKASGVAATIERDAIPLSPGTQSAVKQNATLWKRIVGGGDDYELAFTLPAEQIPELPTLTADLKFPVTPIGRIVAGKPGDVTVFADGTLFPVAESGFRHR